MNWDMIIEIISTQLILYIILTKILKEKLNVSILLPLLCTTVLIIILEVLDYNNDILFFLGDILLFFVIPIIITKNTHKSIVIYLSFFIIGIFSLITGISTFISTCLRPDFYLKSIFNISTDIIVTLIFIILSYNKNFKNFFINIFSLSKNIKIITIIFMWDIIILISLLSILLSKYHKNPDVILFCFLFTITLIISFIVFYLLIANNLKSTYYKKLNDTIQKNMQDQVNHYNQMYKINESLRKFRHDYDNLKIGLNTYLHNNDINGAITYLKSCDEIITYESTNFKTGHQIINALLSEKAQSLKSKNINIVFNGLIPYNALTPVDFCIIFGNILDNAIEACCQINTDINKQIEIFAIQKSDYLFIKCINPTSKNIKIKNNSIDSTKPNSESHGIGLYSIKQVVKKYDGHINMSYLNNVFTIELDFCLIPNT